MGGIDRAAGGEETVDMVIDKILRVRGTRPGRDIDISGVLGKMKLHRHLRDSTRHLKIDEASESDDSSSSSSSSSDEISSYSGGRLSTGSVGSTCSDTATTPIL